MASFRQAANAAHSRIDWKYALSLPLTDPGFDHTMLYEFRGRPMEGGADTALLDLILERFKSLGLLHVRGCQRTDSTAVLSVAWGLNRVEVVRETVKHALESLTVAAPNWLRAHADPHWVERYQQHFFDRLLKEISSHVLQASWDRRHNTQ